MKKHEEVLQYLISLIKSGSIKENEKFPSEARLITKFKYSKQTIREAYKNLAEMGLVYSKQGEGYFLGAKIKNNNLFSYRELYNTPSSTYEYKGIVSAKEILALSTEVKLQHEYYRKIIVKRYSDQELILVEESYLPVNRTPNFDIDLINQEGIFKYLESIEKVKIVYSNKTICAVPNVYKTQLLELFEGYVGPFILDMGRVYDATGSLLEYCLNFYKLENFSWNFIEYRKNL